MFETDKVNINDADLSVLKGILCQSIEDDVTRAQVCLMPGPTGLAPIDDALIALESCRELKKQVYSCLLYTSPSPRDRTRYRMPSSA